MDKSEMRIRILEAMIPLCSSIGIIKPQTVVESAMVFERYVSTGEVNHPTFAAISTPERPPEISYGERPGEIPIVGVKRSARKSKKLPA